MFKRVLIASAFVLGFGLAACGDEGGKVSEEDAVSTCQEFCTMDQCLMDDDQVMSCQGLCDLAAVISACGNGQDILDYQAGCYEEASCDDQQACLMATPACEE